MGLMLLLIACGEDADVAALPPRTLDDVALLTRASLDLRGVRPSIAEIEAVQAAPETLDATMASFLQDERFGARVRSMFSDIYQTRQDSYPVSAADYGLDDEATFAASVGEEPLHILSRIAEEDLPYTQIVTADWTVANETLAQAWPLAYPEGATGWQPSTYTDGRPAAGILTTNGMWWRYQSNGSNANRGRANAISRILLCTDYLGKPIEFERNINLLDQDAVNSALKTNEGCVACHASLDPIASYLWGFYFIDYNSRTDTSSYHPEREEMWQTMTEVPPSYFGQLGYRVDDLGRQIAADPALAQCVVEQVYETMTGTETGLSDTDQLTALREEFLGGGMTLRPLYTAVTETATYRAAPGEDGATTKMMSPELYASAVEDITGYRFTYNGIDMMTTDTYGLRTLAGGVDGVFSTRPADAPTPTMLLVQERLSQAAARYVVDADRASSATPRLFTEIGPTTTPDSDRAAMVRQLQLLHLRVLGDTVATDSAEVVAGLDLWTQLYETDGDAAAAWAGVLSVLLRDPDFLFY